MDETKQTTRVPDHAVAIPISAPIEIDGECYGDWEAFALSCVDGPELQCVCMAKWDKALHRNCIGYELAAPGPACLREMDPTTHAAAVALYQVARSDETSRRLRDAYYERNRMRKEYAKADAFWDQQKEPIELTPAR